MSARISAENLRQLQLFGTLLLLDPKSADVDVPELAGTYSLRDGECSGGVRVHHVTLFQPEVSLKASGAEELGRAFHLDHKLRLGGAECDLVLGTGPTLDVVCSYRQGTPSR